MAGHIKNPVECVTCGFPRAYKAGVRCHICAMRAAPNPKQKYFFKPEHDDLLRRAYGNAGDRNALMAAISEVVRRTSFPRRALLLRAQKLGITCDERHPWTKAEIERLHELVGRYPKHAIAKIMRRTVISVSDKMKRLQMSSRLSEGYSVKDLVDCLGVSPQTVKIWIGRGWLRYGGQGSALHSTRIPEPSVKRFLKEHPEEYRLARVDEAWFKGMLFTAFGVNMNAPKNPRVEVDEDTMEASA
jgi:hypothetical protein